MAQEKMNLKDTKEFVAANWQNMTDREMATITGRSVRNIERIRYSFGIIKEPIRGKHPVVTSTATDELLKRHGISHKELEKMLEAQKRRPKVVKPRKTTKYKFGIVSDTHLVDKQCAIDELHDFYKRCKAEGIKEVVHTGDLLTGQTVYRGQLNDLVCFGFEDHLAYAIDHYPKIDGITTICIAGNHDEDYKKHSGADILEHLAKARDDIVYLGMYDATITLNGVSIGLHHGAGGPSYAESYKLQKYVEKIGSDQKPQVYILGHYHGVFYMFYRNVHCFLPGCWQKPNDFSVRHGFPNMIGGWIVQIEVSDDKHNSIASIHPKFIPYY